VKPRPKPRPPVRLPQPLPVVAHLVSTPKAIQVRDASGRQWQPYQRGRPIRRGELLRPSTATARIRTVQGDDILLNQGTVAQFRGDSIALFRGEVFVTAQHSSRGFVVRTPGTTTTVHGTQFNVKLAGQAAQVTVVEGTVQVGTSAGTCRLTGSQQTTADPGRRPSAPAVVDVNLVIAWTGQSAAPLVAAAPLPPPTEPQQLPGVTFAVKASTDTGWFAENETTVTFVATLQYAPTAPRGLKLATTVSNAAGKTVTQREETLADDEHRYRVKKVVLDRLPVGEYVAQFTLAAGTQQSTREVRFSVRQGDGSLP